jgi:hypothetical protein
MNRRQRKINDKAVENDQQILGKFIESAKNITFQVAEGETDMQAAQKAMLKKGMEFKALWNKRHAEGKRANALRDDFPLQLLQLFGLYEEDTTQDTQIPDEAHAPDGGLRSADNPNKRRRTTKKKSEDSPPTL